jgi:hypothetical protein
MSSSGNQGRGNTIRRRTRDGSIAAPRAVASASAPRTVATPDAPRAVGSGRVPVERSAASSSRVVPQAAAAAAAVRVPAARAAVVGTRAPTRHQETLKLGGHAIRIEREDDRVHLVLGGVFRLMMTLDEAQQLSGGLAALIAGGKPER